MRILHIADVHFGQKSLDDLREPCEQIVQYVTEYEPDLVVIAGDLTVDRGVIDNASALACRTFIGQLAAQTRVLITPGNHDLTHRTDQPDNITAILSDASGPVIDNVAVVDTPQVVEYDDAALAVIPYPSAALFHANTGETSLESLNERLAQLCIGLAAKAIATGKVPLLVFHGTVEGGRHGDERSPAMLTRGTDVVLPTAALAGFHGVLAGHLHHPQEIQAPDGMVVYPGCVAPLTFGERTIEPEAVLWEIHYGGVDVHTHLPLPVTHQRIQVDVTADDWDASKDATLNLADWIERAGEHIGEARVKIAVTASKQRLELLTSELVDVQRGQFHLKELRLEKTTIPEHRSILEEGEDRASRVDIPEALAIYAETCEDPEFTQHLAEVQDVAREIEQIVESQDSDPRYEFKPLALHLENYKSIADVDIDFRELPDRFGVFGPTGIGKSNLILALYWLLYGVNPKSEDGKAKTSLGEIVRRGEKKAKGWLEFESRGVDYKITREVTRSAKGTGTGKLFLTREEETGSVPMDEGTAKQTQLVINAMVGPPELHWLTRHLRQHGESAVKMGAARLADCINSTLQLDFETRIELGKVARDKAITNRDIAVTRGDTLQGQLPSQESIEELREGHESRLRVAKTSQTNHTTELQRQETAHEENRNALALTDAKASEAERLKPRRASLVAELDTCVSAGDGVRARLNAIGDVPPPAELEAEEAVARGKLTEAQAKLNDLRESAATLLQEESEALGGLRESERAAQAAQKDASTLLASRKRAVDDAARAAALLDEVPCEGDEWRPLDSYDRDTVDMSGCQLLTNATEARESLPELTEAVEKCEQRLGDTMSNFEVAAHKHATYQEEVDSARLRRNAKIREAENEAAVCGATHETASNRLASMRNKANNKAVLMQKLAEVEARTVLAKTQLAELDKRLEGTEGLIEEAQLLRDRVDRGVVVIGTTRAHIAELQTMIANAEAGLKQVAEAQKSRAQMLLQIEKLQDEAVQHDRARMAASYYLQSVQRNGIPSLLLERLAPVLERRVNEILTPAQRQLRIETLRTTTTGVTKSEVNLLFQSPTSQGEWIPIAELSGGEEDIANAAWAVGLAQTAAEMSGTSLEMIVLDEPFTGVSAEYDEATRDVLGNIQEHVSRVCLITHKSDLRPMVECSLKLSQNGRGVVMEVQR